MCRYSCDFLCISCLLLVFFFVVIVIAVVPLLLLLLSTAVVDMVALFKARNSSSCS